MRFLILPLFFSLTCIELTRSQNFAPIGATWYFVPTHENYGPIVHFPTHTFQVNRDTLIDGNIAGAVEFDPHAQGWVPRLITYMYEDSGRVYFFEDDTFKLLYDFTLDAGDSMFFRVPRTWWPDENGSPGNDSIRMVLIDSVDWVEKDGFLLKRLHTSPDYNQWWHYIEFGKIVERVGAETGLFGRSYIIHAGDSPEHMRCYEDALLQYTVSYYACDYIDNKAFAPPRAVWHFESFSEDCMSKSYFRIESDFFNEHVDNGQRRVRVYEGASSTLQAEVFLRHDFDEVFFLEDDELKLLYDFSLEAGDTMTFQVPRIRHHFDFTCNDSLPLAPSYQVLVDSVSFQTIDGLELKSMHTSPLGNDCIDLGIVTEKFGSSNGLFGVFCNDCTVGCSGHFRCYSDDDINYMASPENCDYTTSTNAFELHPEITVYPVPSGEFVEMSGLTTQEIQSMMIIDIFGRTFQLPVTQHINLSFLTSGYYILVIETTNGERIVRPVIKS